MTKNEEIVGFTINAFIQQFRDYINGLDDEEIGQMCMKVQKDVLAIYG